MEVRHYTIALFASIGFSTAIAIIWFSQIVETPEQSSNADLRVVALVHSGGYVISWDADRNERCLLVRLRNKTSELKKLHLDLTNLEATISFTVGELEREFSDHKSYKRLMTSEWFFPETDVPAGTTIDWRVPFDRMDAHPVWNKMRNGFDNQKLSFEDCLAFSDPSIKSFWAFRYIPDQP